MILALDLLVSWPSKSEEHIHGGNVPNWYEFDCCSNNDCKPVEDKDISFTSDQFANPIAIYEHELIKLTYGKSRWRNSQDERYHVCYRGPNAYCIYIPIGA